jgi:post-segregation antitoxin (ccd killing protein)
MILAITLSNANSLGYQYPIAKFSFCVKFFRFNLKLFSERLPIRIKNITLNTLFARSDANAMANKGNVVLYLDKDLVQKSKELGINLSKTFENHLKQRILQFSPCNSENNRELTENKSQMVGLPVPK